MDDDKRRENGMKTRRAVLGDAYVDKAVENVTVFNADFQDFITRTAWGDVWQRQALPLRDRSLVVIAMMVALRQWGEFRIHIRGALNNGLTRDEIREVLIQSAIYAGVPSANHAFKEAADVFAQIDAGG